MNKFNYEVRYRTTYCSRECYEREVKKFIWKFQYGLVKREFKSFIKHLFEFLHSIYKWYIKDILISILGFSILLIGYFIINGLIWAIETYIN